MYRYCLALTKHEAAAYDLLQDGLERYLRSAPTDAREPIALLRRILRNRSMIASASAPCPTVTAARRRCRSAPADSALCCGSSAASCSRWSATIEPSPPRNATLNLSTMSMRITQALTACWLATALLASMPV